MHTELIMIVLHLVDMATLMSKTNEHRKCNAMRIISDASVITKHVQVLVEPGKLGEYLLQD